MILINHSCCTFKAILSRIQLRKYREAKNFKTSREVIQVSQFDVLFIYRLINDAVSGSDNAASKHIFD
jgi:hypothetical protein